MWYVFGEIALLLVLALLLGLLVGWLIWGRRRRADKYAPRPLPHERTEERTHLPRQFEGRGDARVSADHRGVGNVPAPDSANSDSTVVIVGADGGLDDSPPHAPGPDSLTDLLAQEFMGRDDGGTPPPNANR